jgi:hypothetical protein
MRTLYQQQHLVSNDFPSIRAKNASEFRGAARGVAMSRTFCGFALIFYNYRPRCADLYNYKQFAAYVQKRLDTRPRCGYNGAGTFAENRHRTTTGAGDLLFLFYLHQTSKKDLTTGGFARILAQATPM